MKINKMLLFFSICSLMFLNGCEKDNYAPPTTILNGKIVYQGNSLNFGANEVTMELWQPGFGKNGAINVNIDQNGNYSALLFNGTYKMIIPSSQGPFITTSNSESNSDTIPIVLNGNKNLDVEVLPYYIFENINIGLKDSIVTAKFDLQKVITDSRAKDIERITLYLNKTNLINGTVPVFQNIELSQLNNGLKNLNISMKARFEQANDAATGIQNYIYAAVGIKLQQKDDMLFTPVQKLSF